ncbi:MAG: phosphatidylserine/phosphatidylglycerophosphate/cardiolipin synthase family protein [Candidatus Eremiobacteraeota bacterium]|nr:phosphatidylserine/phosphatidylglycerophosphate/cardiolipin synthase family protein [Candidatus Eremiobacteraeota bacterium]
MDINQVHHLARAQEAAAQMGHVKLPSKSEEKEKVREPLDRVNFSNEVEESSREGVNKVSVLVDGPPIFSSAKEMIRSAKKSIQVEMFSFSNAEMTDILCSEAKKGIKVQVLLDPSPGLSADHEKAKAETVKKLKASGVEVLYYDTNKKHRQIDHVKLLIVDGKKVLMGGMNWGEHSPMNHDVDLKIEGPAVNYYQKVFDNAWKKSGGKVIEHEGAKPVEGGSAKVKGLSTELWRYTTIGKQVLSNIEGAKKYIHLESFVLSDKKVIDALIKAKNERGVDVKVLLAPNGVNEGWNPNGKTFNKLKSAGIDVKWYQSDTSVKEKLHAKWGVFDGEKIIVGSANWSYKGLHINREIAAEVTDKESASVLEKQFQYDWNNRSADTLEDAFVDLGKKLPQKFKYKSVANE